MKNFFGNFNNQNISQAFQNPLTMAGLAVMQGAPMGQALMQASEMQRQNQLAQAKMAEHEARQQEMARTRLFAQNLPQALKGLGASNIEEATSKLIALGADPEMALKLAQGIRPDIKDRYNLVSGGIDTFENGRYVGPVQAGGIGAGMGNGYAGTPMGQKSTFESGQKIQEKKIESENKLMNEANEEAKAASKSLQTIKLMEDLLPKFEQGILAPTSLAAKGIYSSVTGQKTSASDAQTFKKLAKQVVLDTAKGVGGQASDKDMRLFAEAGAEVGDLPEANHNVIIAAKAVNTRAKQYAKARQEWKEHNLPIEKFDSVWNDFKEAKPLIEVGKDGKYALNKKNIKFDEIFNPDFERTIGAFMPITGENPEQEGKSQSLYDLSDEDIARRIQELEGK